MPPPPPLPPPPPPQAAWKTSPATSREQSRKPASFVFFFRRGPKLIPASASPAIGSHKALNGRDGLAKGRARAAVGAVVVMVRVAGVPGAIEFGFREHCGACAGEGCTACHSRLREFLGVHGYASSLALPDICSVK